MSDVNLYDLFRSLLARAQENQPVPLSGRYALVTDQELRFIEERLKAPDFSLHFEARKIGDYNSAGDPIYQQHFEIAGEQVDIFSLLTEAMQLNPQFRNTVFMAHRFFVEHVPYCKKCRDVHQGECQTDVEGWQFKPR